MVITMELYYFSIETVVLLERGAFTARSCVILQYRVKYTQVRFLSAEVIRCHGDDPTTTHWTHSVNLI